MCREPLGQSKTASFVRSQSSVLADVESSADDVAVASMDEDDREKEVAVRIFHSQIYSAERVCLPFSESTKCRIRSRPLCKSMGMTSWDLYGRTSTGRLLD